TAASMVASLKKEPGRLTPVWCAFGPPCITVYFPLFLEGDMPVTFTGDREGTGTVGRQIARLNEQLRRSPAGLELVGETLARLQGRFDQEAEEFAAEQAALKQADARDELHHRTTRFMQHQLEQFQTVMDGFLQPGPSVAVSSS